MHISYKQFVCMVSFLALGACNSPTKIQQKITNTQENNVKPFGAVPSQRQLAWQAMERYAFIHFNMNTFTDREWGSGAENPELFNPTELDTDQWARVVKEAGMKGIIITAKHHDGFCLWPSKCTEHSVKNSPWKNGKGDLLKELSQSCNKYGIKLGMYLSPWDRNHKDYARPEYVECFHEQLRELLTNYGELFEVWFDGANGGDGYYGGANEKRSINSKTYYGWDKAIAIIRELQPNAVIFGDGGPDARWVGNEKGFAGETNWNTLNANEVYPGFPKHQRLTHGDVGGKDWVPAEVDVSIRPGWYYHAREDHMVKDLAHLVDIFYQSVGRGSNLLLNIPVDRRGKIHPADEKQLLDLQKVISADFASPLLKNQNVKIQTSSVFGKHSGKFILEDTDTFWMPTTNEASVTLTFDKPLTFNRFVVQEAIAYGQRVEKFSIEIENNGQWQPLTNGTTIGYKRILRLPRVTATALRFKIDAAFAPALIKRLELYNAPTLRLAPEIQRSKNGEITLTSYEDLPIYFTTDKTMPTLDSKKYTSAFKPEFPTWISAAAYDAENQKWSPVSTIFKDVPKEKWRIIDAQKPENVKKAEAIIDDNPKTWWASPSGQNSVTIDLGEILNLKGFTYLPPQDRWAHSTILAYIFEVSQDGKNWQKVAEGSFE